MSTDQNYMIDEISKKLVGGRIENPFQDPEGEFFGFHVRMPGQTDEQRLQVWVQCDAEGNGPGWLNIETVQ